MKIVCNKFINSGDAKALTIGKEYMVLEINVINNIVKYCIICDNGRPLPFLIDNFKITDNSIPKSWVASYTENKQLWLSPARWMDDSLWQYSFWEDYWGDDDVKAKQVFSEEVEKMSIEDKMDNT